jgi:hypothetical protein
MGHLLLTGYGLESADQDAAGLSPGLTGNVHAEVAAVDGIDVSMAGVAEKHEVAGSGSAVGVCGGVGRVVVGAEIGLRFHDAAGEDAGGGTVDQELAQKAGSNAIGTVFEPGPGEKAAGKPIESADSAP